MGGAGGHGTRTSARRGRMSVGEGGGGGAESGGGQAAGACGGDAGARWPARAGLAVGWMRISELGVGGRRGSPARPRGGAAGRGRAPSKNPAGARPQCLGNVGRHCASRGRGPCCAALHASSPGAAHARCLQRAGAHQPRPERQLGLCCLGWRPGHVPAHAEHVSASVRWTSWGAGHAVPSSSRGPGTADSPLRPRPARRRASPAPIPAACAPAARCSACDPLAAPRETAGAALVSASATPPPCTLAACLHLRCTMQVAACRTPIAACRMQRASKTLQAAGPAMARRPPPDGRAASSAAAACRAVPPSPACCSACRPISPVFSTRPTGPPHRACLSCPHENDITWLLVSRDACPGAPLLPPCLPHPEHCGCIRPGQIT